MIGGKGSVLSVAVTVALAACLVAADDRDPVAHWKLAGDAKDSSVNRHDAANRGVKFTAKGPDGKSPAAVFDGTGSRLEVKPSPALRFGTGDFTIALWVHTPESLDDDLGDLVTLYDAKKRVGFNLSLRSNTGVTSSQANARQLQFGIDAGSEPKWTDEGRPGNATLAFALAVHDGNLFAGTASHAKDEVGRVYRSDGTGKWTDCGAPDKCNAISALAAHKGKLFAASSRYRFAGSALAESENVNRGGGIYRHEAEKRWIEVGRLPDTEAVGGLVVYKDRLYASSLYKPAGFFRYESDGKWTALAVPDGKRVESLGVFNGFLWATSYDGGRVYRYDGKDWKDFGQLGDNTQTYSFAVHRGRLCVGTWPSGKVYRLDGDRWEDLGRLGAELEVMGMLVHNGQLYAGTLPLAEVYRYDGGQTWTKTTQLDKTPDVKYRRAWTMAQYKGKLFCSTLPSGRVHSLEAGPCVTHDRELAPGWRHVAAVKHGGVLRLYVDGKQVAESGKFDPAKFDLTTDEPLVIGAGTGDHFKGALADVRLYHRALGAEEINGLGRP
jgi:opacity protein-like surface antigen